MDDFKKCMEEFIKTLEEVPKVGVVVLVGPLGKDAQQDVEITHDWLKI
jgi:hypothetical protein